MKQPSAPNYSEAPNIYPTLPTEDGQNYRLQKISEIEKTLINERDIRKSLNKKYKRGINITDGVDTTLISASVILASVSVAFPIIFPLEIIAAACGGLGVCIKIIRRKLMSKSKKHFNIQTIAETKLNSISDIISKSLEDGTISPEEFKTVLVEMEKYYKLKKETKGNHTQKIHSEITDEIKKKLIEQGRIEAMETIEKTLKTV